MDRIIVYASSIPQDSDILSTNRNAMIGLGAALQDIMSAQTFVAGLPCTQTIVASLAVLMGPGRIYSLQNVDGTPYGSLAADTTDQILKQGIQFGSVTLATAAPVTVGFSINYLIEASYQDVDGVPVVLPYYNASNPTVPFSGPGNLGTPQNTVRKGTLVVQAKAGIPATTGTQTTPAPDAGFVGLYVVTVANGQATVTSTNITVSPGAPFNSGTFLGTLTGCTTAPTGTVKWVKNGNLITVIIPPLSATSNTNACAITGMPANLFPTTAQGFGTPAISNNGATAIGGVRIDTAGNLNLFVNGVATGFTTSGTKGITTETCVSWLIGI